MSVSFDNLPDGYWSCAAGLAEKALRLWIASGDPMEGDEAVEERWELLCDLAGVDPEEFRRGVQMQLLQGGTPMLACGHPGSDENMYHPRGTNRRTGCRACAKEAGQRTRHQVGTEGGLKGSGG